MTCDNTHRLLYQYQSSPRLRALILALTREYCSIEVVLNDLITRLDIDLSVGAQLDQIGIIVGQPRPLVYQAIDENVFVFFDGDGAGWSGVGRADVGGRFIGLDLQGNPATELVGAMADVDYRTLLRARIYSNRANVTVESIVEFLNFVLGAGGNSVVNTTRSISLVVRRPLSAVEEVIVRSLVPVAAGIAVDEIYDPENPAP